MLTYFVKSSCSGVVERLVFRSSDPSSGHHWSIFLFLFCYGWHALWAQYEFPGTIPAVTSFFLAGASQVTSAYQKWPTYSRPRKIKINVHASRGRLKNMHPGLQNFLFTCMKSNQLSHFFTRSTRLHPIGSARSNSRSDVGQTRRRTYIDTIESSFFACFSPIFDIVFPGFAFHSTLTC